VFDKTLRSQVVFSDHSLVTDAVFAEMHLISCRNVLIYFDRELRIAPSDCSAIPSPVRAF
jgi:chemotaxis protein methyltransferase CheR